MKLNIIRKYFLTKKIDSIILFSDDPNLKYFLDKNIDPEAIIITRKKIILFASALNKIITKKYDVIYFNDFKEYLKKLIMKENIKITGINENNITLKQHKLLRKNTITKEIYELLKSLRETKTKEEMKNIRKACFITDNIFKEIIENIKKRKYKKEKDIEEYIKKRAIENDAWISFKPIIASEKSACTPHHNNSSEIKKGFLLMDFGIKYNNYCSDMTRTIYLGKPNEEEVRTYELVKETNEKCIEKARAGMKTKELDEYARKIIGKEKYFIHGLGHGVGIEIHESPRLNKKSNEILKKHSVFTIEPGYYDKKRKIGIRIEDDVYLGEKKEVLTKSTKELIIIN